MNPGRYRAAYQLRLGLQTLSPSGAGRLTNAGVCGKISLMHDSAQFNPPMSHGHKLTGLRHAAIILLAATLLGFFFAAQIYFSAASLHRPVSWGQALYWSFGDWYEWALLSPVIFWICRRFPID